jgi:hypothetical protein
MSSQDVLSSKKSNYRPGLCSIKGLEAGFRVLVIELFCYDLQVYNKFLVEICERKWQVWALFCCGSSDIRMTASGRDCLPIVR